MRRTNALARYRYLFALVPAVAFIFLSIALPGEVGFDRVPEANEPNSGGGSSNPYGLGSAEAIGDHLGGSLPSATPGGVKNWEVTPAFPFIEIDRTLVITPMPRSNKLVAATRDGILYTFDNDPNATQRDLFLDHFQRTAAVWDGGFLGIAFHPEFGDPASPNRGYLYVYYCARNPGASYPTGSTGGYFNVWCHLSRFTVPDGSTTVDPNSELVMMKMRLYNGSHRGGGLQFGPDGFLYLTIGEMFVASYAQDMVNNLYGGVHRIDVDMDPSRSHPPIRTLPVGPSGPEEFSGVGYWIPNDNPFLSPSGAQFEEYFSTGHRAPHRLAIDPLNGRIWVGEIGAGSREEINVVVAGGNYGWPFREGTVAGPSSPPGTIEGTLTEPALDFLRSEANAIIGGYVYRGTQFPGLWGKYICGGYSQDRMWALTYDEQTGTATKEYLCQFTPENLYTFGQDHDGEIFFGGDTPDNRIYRLQCVGSTEDPPATLSATGAFTDLTTLTVAPGIIPYRLNVPFWSDGAIKSRWMAIPNDGVIDVPSEQILYSEEEEWEFPIGSVFIKHFDLPVDDTDPSVTQRIETRFLVHGDDDNYYGLTYKWLPDESDAVLVDVGGEDVDFTIQTGSGTRTQTWHYPARTECLNCHNQAAGDVLGVKSRQLNCEITYPQTGNSDNQLRALNRIGVLSPPIDESEIPNILTATPPDHPTASLQDKARSYIDSNCAACHRPGTGNRALFDARLSTPFEMQGLVNGEVLDNLGIVGARVLAPMDVGASIAHLRTASLDPTVMMPPLAKNVVDAAGLQLMTDWINSLEPDVEFDPLAVGLVGHWPLDEGAPSAIALDASGEQNTGLLTNIETDDWVEGRIGLGIRFDAADEYMEVPNAIELEVGKTDSDFSVAYWFFLEEGATGQWRVVTHKGNVDSERTFAMWMQPNDDRLHYRISTTAGFNEGGDSQAEIAVGSWTHVAYVKSGSTLSLYLNGALDSQAPLAGPSVSNDGPVYVGDSPWSGGVNARFDDFRIYSRALSATDVSTLAEPAGEMVAWLRLDETSGATAADATGNGNDGTLIGMDDTNWTVGHTGGGLDLDADDTRVEIAGDASLRLGDGDEGYTIALWLNLETGFDGTERTIIQQGDSQRHYALKLRPNDDRVDYRANTLAYWDEGGTSQSELTVGTWHHLAMVKSDGLLSFYLNGALDDETALVGPTTGSNEIVYLGDVPFYGVRGADAIVDDVRLYPRALNKDEVAALTVGIASGTPGLSGEYFDNIDLTNLVLTRIDPTVNFNWGSGSPDGAIGANTFSIRWTGSVLPLFTEVYTFYTQSDDGVRLWIDDQPIVDEWVDQGSTEHSGTIPLVSGESVPVRLEYYENGGAALAQLRWSSASQPKEIIPEAQLSTSSPVVQGLQADYYDNIDFTSLEVSRIDPVVDFNWGSGSPDPAIGNDTFSCRWTGFVIAEYTDTYTFYTESDDGIRLWVDGTSVIDEWNDHPPTEHSGTIAMTAGQPVPITLEHYEQGGGAVARLLWSATGVPKAVIPAEQLFPGSVTVRDAQDPSVVSAPPALALGQNHPNPFNPATTIRYAVPQRSHVDLRIFEVSGRLVRTLVAAEVPPGEYTAIWDGRDETERSVASGVYYYRLRSGDEEQVRRMTLIR